MSAKLIRNCGRALLGVFVVTVLAVLFPLNLQAPGWGQRLSTLIVDAASLPLVGLLLMRYAAHLDAESAKGLRPQELATGSSTPGFEGEEELFEAFEKDEEMRQSTNGIRQLAFGGFILLILLAIWQFFIASSSLNTITDQDLELLKQIDTRFQGIEQNIKVAPQEEISKLWSKSQPKNDLGPSTSNPNSATQRGEILQNVKGQKLKAIYNLQTKTSSAQFNLVRNIIRVMLMSIIYAWGFYGIAKL